MAYSTYCEYCYKTYVVREDDAYTWKAHYCSVQCERAAGEKIRAAEEKKEREKAAELQRQQNQLLEIQLLNERAAHRQAEARAKHEAEERAKREAEEREKRVAEERERAKLRNCKWCGKQYNFTTSGAGRQECFCGRKCEKDFKNDVLHGNSSSVTGDDWVMLIWDDPGLFSKCPLKKLTWNNWYTLIGKYPQFAKKCPLQHFDQSAQDRLLQYAEMRQVALTKFSDVLSGNHWVQLIYDDPEKFAKCPKEKLSLYDWQDLCDRHPQFIESFPWKNFNKNDQCKFLNSSEKIRNYISTKHRSYLNGHHWVCILLSSPELFNKCPLKKLTFADWKSLIGASQYWLNQCPLEKFTLEEQNELRRVGGQCVSPPPKPVKNTQNTNVAAEVHASDGDVQQAIFFIGGILLAIFCSIWWVRWIICPFLILAGVMTSKESGSQNKKTPLPTNSNKQEAKKNYCRHSSRR